MSDEKVNTPVQEQAPAPVEQAAAAPAAKAAAPAERASAPRGPREFRGNRGGDRGDRRGHGRDRDRNGEGNGEDELDERVVFVNRCAKVVKGGRRFSFSAVVVVGDHKGHVGLGFGKANEVSDAIRKGGEAGRKNMMSVKLKGRTIPHEVTGACDGGKVLIKPAPDGAGLIVGGGMRPLLEAAGVMDAVGKSLGSKNRLNVVKATVAALNQLRSAEEIAAARA